MRLASGDTTRWIHEEHLDRGECGGAVESYWPGDIGLTLWGDTACFPKDVHHIVLPPGTAGADALKVNVSGVVAAGRAMAAGHGVAATGHGAVAAGHGAVAATGHGVVAAGHGVAATGHGVVAAGHGAVAAAPPQPAWRVSDPRLVAAAQAAYGSDEAFERPRRRQLFFAGSVRFRKDHQRRCYHPVTPEIGSFCRKRWTYSFGARQTVQLLLANHPMVSFNQRSATTQSGSYHATLRSFTFCLSVTGKSFCPRIADIIASGCIPVRILPGHVLWPFEPDLDYSRFSVDVPFEDIPRLPSILANLSDAEVRAKRRALRKVHRMFIWDDVYGRAYEATIEALRRRL